MDTTPGQLTRDGKTVATFNVPGMRRHPRAVRVDCDPPADSTVHPGGTALDARAAAGGRDGVR